MNSRTALFLIAGILSSQILSAAIPEGWKYGQEVKPQGSGIVRLKVPWETVAHTANSFADFRILDSQGKETAYAFDQQELMSPVWIPQDQIKTMIEKTSTLLFGQVKAADGNKVIDAVQFAIPDQNFIKSVTVRGSQDAKKWVLLADRSPIFRQSYQAENLAVYFNAGAWRFLKVEIDDSRETPVPITQVFVRSAQSGAVELDRIELSVGEAVQNGSATDITFKFPSAQYRAQRFALEVQDPIFQRHVEIWASFEEWNHQKRERMVGSGTIFRVSNGKGEKIEVLQIESNPVLLPEEVTLKIINGDAPPLTIKKATAQVLPFMLLFYAKEGETYQIVIGNPAASRKVYDLTQVQSQLKSVQKGSVVLGTIVQNPNYKEPEVLADLEAEGTPIDVSQWQFRRKILLSRPGVQKLELDLDVLTRNGSRTQDLRLVRNGNQIPYIVSPESPVHDLSLSGKNLTIMPGKQSRWQISVPYQDIPATVLECEIENPIFQRAVRLYEQVPDERGDTTQSSVGNEQWTRVSGTQLQSLQIIFSRPPQTQTLYLEIENGDNSPLKLKNFRLKYHTRQILFKAAPGSDLYLYYGNPDASPPSYEINLLQYEILKAKPEAAALEANQDVLKVEPWYSFKFQSKTMKYIFWAVMGLVSVVLLGVIGKLLPEDGGSRPA